MMNILFSLLTPFIVLTILGIFILRDHKKRVADSEVLPGDKQLFESYRRFLNEQVGMFSFTFALAALGTESPQFYAFLSLALVLIVWASGARRYKNIVKIWNERKHYFLSALSIFLEFPIFLFGYATLFLVLFGILEKTTLKNTMLFFNFI